MVGGGVALAAAGALVAQSFAPLGALLGGGAAVAAAGGGLMVAQEQCLGEFYLLDDRCNVMCAICIAGPLYCRARSGQCCELILRRRILCPPAC